GYRASFVFYFSFGASYREIATFLGVHASTIYRQVASIRRNLPSLQRLLGSIRYSGNVAVDEKYVLAPKPHRDGKMGRWVYLFLAIDPYTYDLLHAQVYPARNTDCARAFLLSLKAQGVLTPKAVVTDLWGPYETVIPEVFPGAVHHQCVFHAEQAASTMLRDKLGPDYRSVPQAEALRQAIVQMFRAGCRRTLIRRYAKLLAHKKTLLTGCPQLAPVFASLARHFEKVANAYADRRLCIPKTSNAVERVFRTFTRRYKTMAGFERLETAQNFVLVWACYYRFRPFSPDADRRIRNRSPLQLAGYDLAAVSPLDLLRPPLALRASS
ncbi:MAG: DDE-type integrase/transposase/recombinase, partial [Gammaproteobacteria bacterium]|nr:DDE-type integrase/transposase/recombinase [Gammaproteobacteria bacterium]